MYRVNDGKQSKIRKTILEEFFVSVLIHFFAQNKKWDSLEPVSELWLAIYFKTE